MVCLIATLTRRLISLWGDAESTVSLKCAWRPHIFRTSLNSFAYCISRFKSAPFRLSHLMWYTLRFCCAIQGSLLKCDTSCLGSFGTCRQSSNGGIGLSPSRESRGHKKSMLSTAWTRSCASTKIWWSSDLRVFLSLTVRMLNSAVMVLLSKLYSSLT